ncbi:alpha/beta hydrolase family protein [Terricaulis sp.]|uniref:alpha/beta hydrolase family protein n=1 Tax=Terricaulis sp. TaxID=2768686 RepID=UPI003783FB23
MKPTIAALWFLLAGIAAAPAFAACEPGAYGDGRGDAVVLAPNPRIPAPDLRYMFLDGRIGSTADNDPLVACVDGGVRVGGAAGAVWRALPFTRTDTAFTSVGTRLVGRLIEPAGNDPQRPLVVMVHGSERTSPLNSAYAYALAAQGIAVFVYDKRGTGGSAGEYTQNFELLAADAAAALTHARELARGRFARSGFFGGSQGGWVAPLAATRTPADFVAVGFGLVASPIEEDREQMISEARALHLDPGATALINQLSAATARLLLSDFHDGYRDLARVRQRIAGQPWAHDIHGEYSGEMLWLDESELRRLGAARFDNVELIWDYDAVAVLQRLDTPLLWVLAEQDREAPIETTRRALTGLIRAGKPVDLYLFPDTDHGMFEFVQNPDGSRTSTRITDGYLRLLADWIRADAHGAYGRAQRLSGE